MKNILLTAVGILLIIDISLMIGTYYISNPMSFGPGEIDTCDDYCVDEFKDAKGFNFYYGVVDGKLYCICSELNNPRNRRSVDVQELLKKRFDGLNDTGNTF